MHSPARSAFDIALTVVLALGCVPTISHAVPTFAYFVQGNYGARLEVQQTSSNGKNDFVIFNRGKTAVESFQIRYGPFADNNWIDGQGAIRNVALADFFQPLGCPLPPCVPTRPIPQNTQLGIDTNADGVTDALSFRFVNEYLPVLGTQTSIGGARGFVNNMDLNVNGDRNLPSGALYAVEPALTRQTADGLVSLEEHNGPIWAYSLLLPGAGFEREFIPAGTSFTVYGQGIDGGIVSDGAAAAASGKWAATDIASDHVTWTAQVAFDAVPEQKILGFGLLTKPGTSAGENFYFLNDFDYSYKAGSAFRLGLQTTGRVNTVLGPRVTPEPSTLLLSLGALIALLTRPLRDSWRRPVDPRRA